MPNLNDRTLTRPPRALPTGTLTFLLTDIEGSTALWDQHPGEMRLAITRHDAIVDEVLARYDGQQIKERGEGDSIFAVFTSPASGIAAVCALQRALAAEAWPSGITLRVRAGLHTGEADQRSLGYYGLAVNKTARIRSLAHGGQILLSRGIYELVYELLPPGLTLQYLGSFGLRGLQRPEDLYQVVHPDLRSDFPPLECGAMVPSNLPVALTSFIGRERELEAVQRLLQESRLLTLMGAGGAGKTRLALQVAATLLEEQAQVQYPDGIWLIELAPLTDPGLVTQAVATALGVREEANCSPQVTLLEAVSSKRLLLLLDNCEHVIMPCAELVASLLRTAPQVKILATSREALGVPGETAWRMPSLSLPERVQTPTQQGAAHSDAVSLFVERARAVRPDFALTEQNTGTVTQIVSRLDGIPLAIELAAARISALSAEQIAARLDDSFRLLTGGPRIALPRQQTLRAALDWSYNLLDDDERTVLRRLAVFSGGWTLSAAEAICGGDGVEEWRVLDLLAQLENKSLVLTEEGGGETHYRLLETVRQYARERLATATEAASIRNRHRDWYLALAEQAEPGLIGRHQAEWLRRVEAERDNIRAALEWGASSRHDAALVLRIASALWRFWEVRGPLSEGQRWLDESLASGVDSPALRLKALLASGELSYRQGNNQFARARFAESRTLALELGDSDALARSAFGLGWVAHNQGGLDEAQELFEQSLALWRQIDNTWGIAYSLNGLGMALAAYGDTDRGLAIAEEGFLLRRRLGDTWGLISSLNNLGNAALLDGRRDRAREFLAEGMDLARSIEYQEGIGLFLIQRGFLGMLEGRFDEARSLLEQGTAMFRQAGARLMVADALHGEALLATFTADFNRAERLRVERLGLLQDLDNGMGVAVEWAHLAYLAICQDDYVRAATLARNSLQAMTDHHDPENVSWAKAVQGTAMLGLGDLEQAQRLFEESVMLLKVPVKGPGRTHTAALALVGLSNVALLTNRLADAARFLGVIAFLFEREVLPLDPYQRAEVARAEQRARQIPGDDAYTRAWEEGKARGWNVVSDLRRASA